jgi:chromosome segregation protein
MFLKELQMSGFKSFAQTVRLELQPGVTAIVGPNGSGKSNIVDAVRWVLGEQSARALRGAKSEDVIFAGSAARHPLGMAEVSLVLDNAEGRVPSGLAEVGISRRLFRSGDTEYLLNRKRARLRDVLDVAAQSGLGPDSYCVVGQGAIDQLVMQRPQDRRALIADAAEIRRFEARLAQIDSDLQQTQQNALRISAVVNELRPQLDRMKTQAARAERHRRVRDELEFVARAWYRRAVPGAQSEVVDAERRRAELQARIAESRVRVAELEEHRATLHRDGLELRSRLAELEQALGPARTSREQLRVQQAGSAERSRALTVRLGQLDEELKAVAEQQAPARTSLETSEDALRQAEQAPVESVDVDAPGTDVGQLDTQIATARRRIGEAQRQLDEARRTLERLDREELESRVAQEAAQRAAAVAAERRSEIEARLVEIDRALAGEQATLQTTRAELTKLDPDSDAARVALENVRRARQAAETAETTARRELDRLLGEQRGLERLFDKSREGRSGESLIGRLAAPIEFQRAVAAALGNAVTHGLVEAGRDAWNVDGGERAETTLVPAEWPSRLFDSFPEQVASVLRPRLQYWLASEVLGEGGQGSLAQRYLGRVIIVATLAEARAAAPLLQSIGLEPFDVATLDGHALRSNGEHVLRPVPDVEQSINLRTRMAELDRAVSSANETVVGQGATLESARAEEERHRTALEVIEEHRRSLRGRISSSEQSLRGLQADQQRERSRLGQLPTTPTSVRQSDLPNLQARRDAAAASRDTAGAQLDEARRLLAAFEAQRANRAQQQATVAASRALAEERKARLRDAIERDQREVTRLTRLLETLRDERARLADELGDLRARTAAAEEELARAEANVQRLESEATAASARLSAHEEEVERATAELESALGALADWRTGEAAAGTALEHAHGTLERLRVEMESTAEALAIGPDDLLRDSVAIPGEIAGLDDESLQRRLVRAQRDLRNVGGVDYGVLAEYNRLDERYRFLTEQLDDLARTETAIRESMGDVRERMRAQFATAFEDVNERFKVMFQSLFRGGDAELLLVGEPDSPQFGVDIVAQPPGKHLHRLATLSGGERALVGGALLLALIGANPSPFCMLDEVDAALDEANVQRFASTVREMSGQTQFILVTHNRATMEAADALYGVTMSPGAVSQVLSIRLPDV